MKKFTVLLMCFLMAFSTFGCVDENEPAKEAYDGETQQIEKTEEKTTFALNEIAVFDDLKFTALEMKETMGEEFFEPDEGNVFVGINFVIENISDESQSISSILLFDAYADDVLCEYSFNAACAFPEGQLDGEISPGKKMIGWYPLEVPKDWEKLELEVQSSWLSSKKAIFLFNK